MQLGVEGQCEACPRGTYRTQGVEAACQACPTGRTTAKVGAANVEECSLPVCPPGNSVKLFNFIIVSEGILKF
jgi:hypothetical protein